MFWSIYIYICNSRIKVAILKEEWILRNSATTHDNINCFSNSITTCSKLFWTFVYLFSTKWSDWNKLHINETVPILLFFVLILLHYFRYCSKVVKFVSVKCLLFQIQCECLKKKKVEDRSNPFVKRWIINSLFKITPFAIVYLALLDGISQFFTCLVCFCRYYMNRFKDAYRQATIDHMLGEFFSIIYC